jgi:hypothetical protein
MRLDNVLTYGLLLFAGACGLLGWLAIEFIIWLFDKIA